MFGKNKEYVSYINSDGKEIVLSVNRFNRKKVLSDIFMKGSDLGDYYFIDNFRLKFIYFKNFVFDCNIINATEFSGKFGNDVVMVLDNCLFKGRKVNFYCFGNVQIIDPSFEFNGKVVIECERVNDVDLVFNKDEASNKYFEICVSECKNFSFVGNDNKCDFFVKADNVSIDRVTKLEKFKVLSDNIKIINSNIFCKDDGYTVRCLDDNCIYIKGKEIQLFNSSIKGSFHGVGGNGGVLIFDSVSGNNYEIMFKGGIRVNNDYYVNESNDNYYVLFSDRNVNEINKFVLRRNFISVLKGVSDSVNNVISYKVDLLNSFYDSEIREQEIRLDRMRRKARFKVKCYEKKLVKSNFTDFMD